MKRRHPSSVRRSRKTCSDPEAQAYDPPVAEHLTAQVIGDYPEQGPEPENARIVGERVNQILRGKARTDLHALLHIDPFFNGRDRAWDPGWSCRDHSVVLAALLTTEGVKTQIVHGMTAFLQGSTSDGEPPIGIGGGAHSWLRVPGFGTLDVSPRLNERLPNDVFRDWRPLPVGGGLIGERWDVSGMDSLVVFVNNAGDYEQRYNLATHETERAVAIYWPQKVVDFTPDMLDGEYINSSLTDVFIPVAGADGYVRLAAHIFALLRDDRRPLARVSQRKAWHYLNEIGPELLHDFHRAIHAGLSKPL
jgi:hypothetical protein